MFGESCFAHGDLLRGHNQYAGRSLNVNGPVCRDAYSGTFNSPRCEDWICLPKNDSEVSGLFVAIQLITLPVFIISGYCGYELEL
ncbi:hypothetical protein EcCFBP13530_23880 [Enterobacter cancerogenus]|uniref:Uncharacterized protein n=1 Tax=Enterobacter cancerogenus TaxID=69218 RepID=A0AB38NY21_9ENTR|nr:hypothetical protein EcCFBP13530_23880 [Enterobacter cancerogenus]